MEREADARAIVLLQRAKIHTAGLASFFRSLKDDKESDNPLPDWLSSHPGLQERAEAAARAETSKEGRAAMTDAEWHAVQQMCTAP
jgi:predicted Zn-dependent protease